MTNLPQTKTKTLEEVWKIAKQHSDIHRNLLKVGSIEVLRSYHMNLSLFLLHIRSKWMNKRRLKSINKERLQQIYNQLLAIDLEIVNHIFTNERGGDFLISVQKLHIPASVVEGEGKGGQQVGNDEDFFYSKDLLEELARLEPPK